MPGALSLKRGKNFSKMKRTEGFTSTSVRGKSCAGKAKTPSVMRRFLRASLINLSGQSFRDELLGDPSQLGVAAMASRAIPLNEIKPFVNLVVTQAIIESLAVRWGSASRRQSEALGLKPYHFLNHVLESFSYNILVVPLPLYT